MDATTGILVLVGVFVLFALMYFLGLNEVIHRTVTCPRSGKSAVIGVVQRYGKPDRAVRVKSCDLVAHSGRVDCEQECLRIAP